jgi:hypothetical protein
MFSRRKIDQSRSITPAPTYLDAQWFAGYWDKIINASSVNPADDGNRIELILFTLNLLDSAASDYMSQRGDARAFAAYREAMENPDNCTAEAKVSLIVGWNPQALPLIEQKLDKFSGTLIEAGHRHGHLRFFPSECHGQPRSYPDGHPICSACKRPAEFLSAVITRTAQFSPGADRPGNPNGHTRPRC